MTATLTPLRAADAKTHTVVVVRGEERYLYKDAHGWYVLGVVVGDGVSPRHYLTTNESGEFEGVTQCAV